MIQLPFELRARIPKGPHDRLIFADDELQNCEHSLIVCDGPGSFQTDPYTPTPWTNVTIVYNGVDAYTSDNYQIFVNGKSLPLTNLGQNGGYTVQNRIGNDAFGSMFGFSNSYLGSIDDLLIYNTNISDVDAATIYNDGAGLCGDKSAYPAPDNLVAGYHFDDVNNDPTTTTLADFANSGNETNNDGTLSGAFSWVPGFLGVKYTATALSAGTNTITAAYTAATGSPYGDTTSAPATVHVLDITAAITGTPTGPVVEGTPITLGSSVTGNSVTGNDGDPITYAWSVTDSLGDAVATGDGASLTFTPMAVDTFTVSLTVTVDGLACTADAVHFDAAGVATTTALEAPASEPLGTTVTLRATVTPDNSIAALGGNVDFRDGDAWLGTAAVDASGVATLAVDTLLLGAHALTADYSGDDHYTASTDAQSTTIVPATAFPARRSR